MKIKLFFFAISILLTASTIQAEIQSFSHTVKQPFSGSQSPDDARIAAIHKAKREVLEMAGTYIESMTVVKNSVVEKDEIIALAAGVLKAEIVGEPQPYVEGKSFGINVIAKVDVDTSILEQRVKGLLKDKTLLGQLKESQERERELLERIKNLERQNKNITASTSKDKKDALEKEFRRASSGLNAVEFNNKALALWNHGFYTDVSRAIMYLEQAIEIDPDYANAYNNLGRAYDSKGEYDQAIGYFEKALKISLKKLGPDHPRIASAYNDLGIAYKNKGEYDRAIEYYEKSLKIWIKKLGPDHSGAANTYGNLGVAYIKKREYDRAIEYFEKALKIHLKKLGPDHPSIANSYVNLGVAYNIKGEYDRAIEYFKKALKIELKKLGPDHPSVTNAYGNLGIAYKKKGEYDQAIEYFEKALKISLKKLGPDHPKTKSIQKDLASVHRMKSL